MSDDFQMKFVTAQDGDTKPALMEAFNMLREHGLSPEWLSHEECLRVEAADKNTAYVIDPFQGPAFEHLKLLACRVYGAQSILASLHMKVELPQKKRPIYAVAMKGVTVCCTSLDRAVRDHVHRLVELMAGETTKNLVTEVTHMVAGEVGSQKYAVAASRGTPIMTVDWVNTVWEMAQHGYVHGTDSQFAKLRCPVFKGLVVTVSGLAVAEREKVKRDVENEGGTYTGEMKMNECTHLIIKEPRGQKYNFACKWKIHVVTLRWLYESLDKNYCQDEKLFPVTGSAGPASSVKMSTPENKSSDVRPNITDISAISTNNTHIDETAISCTRLSYDTTAEGESLESLDVSCVGRAEHFIDWCRLYLSSGLRGTLLEKCKKMINMGGATRLNGINENITHVIMEDKVDQEINAVNNLDLRPHVVNALWLVECFKQGRHVSEQAFLSPHLLLSDLELPKLQVSARRSVVDQKKSMDVSKGRQAPGSSSSLTTAKGGEKDDGEMGHLLSQYMDDSSGQGETTVQPMDEVDGNSSVSTLRQTGRCSSQDDEPDDATQDPDSEVTAADTGVFAGKTFVFYGFSEDDVALLTNLTTEAGGVVMKDSGRKVADYGIVPLFGCPVKQTVGHVVTNTWLEMCIEAKELLNVEDDNIFQPLDITEETRPLQGCVLSVSGYQGVERSCLRHVADALGAVCQEHFVRIGKKSLQASTHLILKEPCGQKYNAAKKWNLPTVTKQWLLACARSGQREDEDKFDIDNVSNDTPDSPLIPQQQAAATRLAQPAQQHSSGTRDCSVPSGPHSKPALQPSDTGSRCQSRKDVTEQVEAKETKDCSTPTTEAAWPSPLSKPTFLPEEETPRKPLTSGIARSGESSGPGSRSKPTLLQRDGNGAGPRAGSAGQAATGVAGKMAASTELMAPAPSSSADSASVDRVSASSASDVDASNPMSSAKTLIRQPPPGGCQLSQKENLTAVLNTVTPDPPKKPAAHTRLQQQSRTPFLSPGLESPSVYMAPGWRPKFDLTAVFEYWKTPDAQKNKDSSESPTLEELMDFHLDKALEICSVPQASFNDLDSSPKSQCEDRAPLAGVVLCVAKKLGVNQAEYNSIVVELGGDYSWLYSTSCTHFIFEGRANDLNREFRLARSQAKVIVSPHWLYACLEKRCRVDEVLFPHTFNPNMNLGGVVRKETPARSLCSVSFSKTTPGPSPAPNRSANTRTPARPAKAAARQKGTEMKKWQVNDGCTPATDCGDRATGTGRKRAGPVVEVTSTKRMMTPKAAETGPQSEDSGGRNRPGPVVEVTSDKMTPKAAEKGPQSEGSKAGASSSSPSPDYNLETTCQAQTEKSAGSNTQLEPSPDPVLTEAAQECGGSLEIREALSKTLETVKASSSRSKKLNKRRNRRPDQNSSGDQTNLSGNLPDAVSHHASPWETKHHAQVGVHTTESLGAEASQSVQITWDDPTGRREQEKLAHKLDMVCGPSQSTQNMEDLMANLAMPDDITSPPSPKQEQMAAMQQEEVTVRSPTPEPPPLAFPTANRVSAVAGPQPVELISEESGEDPGETTTKPVILTSGMGPQERIEFAELVETLGGTLLEKQQFDPACSHVVVVKPTRNEKFLAAVATGRWVLHKSYLIACRQEGQFVREADHEWGNPAMSQLMQSLDRQTLNLVQAAYRWRQKVHAIRKTQPGCKGAFEGWRAILLTEPKREDNFRRLLIAGGATVMSVKPPFGEVSATHAFVELHKVKLCDTDLQALVQGVDHILRPEFIAAHLTEKDPLPDNYTPAEIESLRFSINSRKRKTDQPDDSGSKRQPQQ